MAAFYEIKYFCLSLCALKLPLCHKPPYKRAQLARRSVTKCEGCCVHTMTKAKKSWKRSVCSSGTCWLKDAALFHQTHLQPTATKSIVSPQLSLPITCSQVFTLSSLFCALHAGQIREDEVHRVGDQPAGASLGRLVLAR